MYHHKGSWRYYSQNFVGKVSIWWILTTPVWTCRVGCKMSLSKPRLNVCYLGGNQSVGVTNQTCISDTVYFVSFPDAFSIQNKSLKFSIALQLKRLLAKSIFCHE